MILSDQHHAGIAGYTGDSWVRTPALDRLSREGVTFDAAYCASPLCVPSRSALLSGVHTSANGCVTNHTSLRSDRATFVHALSCADYDTVLCGRMHFVGHDQRHGFRKRLVGDLTPTLFGGTRAEYGVLEGTAGQNLRSLQLSGPGNSNVIEYDRTVTDAACDYLASVGKSGRTGTRDQPFFLLVGLYAPHCPFVCPADLFHYYYERVGNPAIPEGYLDSLHPAVQKWRSTREVEKAGADDIRRCRAAYYGLVEMLDGNIGRIMEGLDRSGLADDTIVVYASDHGDMIGENGMFWKSNLYEGSVRVPLIFRSPQSRSGGTAGRPVSGDPDVRRSEAAATVSAATAETEATATGGGRRISSPVSLLDIAPTLISLTGAENLPEYHGEDLMPVLRGERDPDPDRAVISICTDPRTEQASAMIRRGKWKLVEFHGHRNPQLFDLKSDPKEKLDRGTDPDCERARSRLHDQLVETIDLRKVDSMLQKAQAHAEILNRYGGRYESEMEYVKENWLPAENPNRLERID